MSDLLGWLFPAEWTLRAMLLFGSVSLLRMFLIFGVTYTLYNSSVSTRWERPMKIVVVPLFVVSYIYDILLNHTVVSVMCWERPQGWRETITGRMRRYLRYDDGWRRRISEIICTVLNKFDGDHCTNRRREKTAALRRYMGLS